MAVRDGETTSNDLIYNIYNTSISRVLLTVVDSCRFRRLSNFMILRIALGKRPHVLYIPGNMLFYMCYGNEWLDETEYDTEGEDDT